MVANPLVCLVFVSELGGGSHSALSLKQKCLPILLYGLDLCNLDKRSMYSLDFTVNRFFMKLFQTSNMEIVMLSKFVWV